MDNYKNKSNRSIKGLGAKKYKNLPKKDGSKAKEIMDTKMKQLESPVNMEEKTICLLLLDVSYSMNGEPIKLLNAAIKEFYDDIKNGTNDVDPATKNRLEIAVVKFDTTPERLQDPALIEEFDSMPTLTAQGCTCTSKALKLAIDIVEERKAYYKEYGIPYLRPWIILMTDGCPTDNMGSPIPENNAEIIEISEIISKGIKDKHYEVLGIGVGDADMGILSKMTGENVLPLDGLKFSAFFKWLSNSMSKTSISKPGDTIDISKGIDKFVSKMRAHKV